MNNMQSGKLGVFALAMMSVAGVFTLRSLPMMATYGYSAIFYYIFVALIFFIPSALMCAELATGWPKTGGLYIWVREAFGSRIGILAIWFEWINTVISFPATLAFIVATLAYAIHPELANNKYYMIILMLTLFWGATLVNFLGIRFSSGMSTTFLIVGTILPCLLIMALSVGWVLSGHHVQVAFSVRHLMPKLHVSQSAFLVGLMLGYAGMQIAGFHAQETRNPQRDFPRAAFMAVLIILFLSIFGSLAISLVVPTQEINVVVGIMQSAQIFFSTFHMRWFIPIIAILTALGTFAMMNMWIIGPCKGLLAMAQHGELPKIAQKMNKHGAPTRLLVLQAVVGSAFSLVYLYMPSIASSYWLLLILSAMLTLLMYILMFGALLRLRYTQPDTPRAYRVPGGKIGVWLVSGIGIAVCAIGFFIGFVPPAQLHIHNLFFYESFLVGGILLIAVLPFVTIRSL